MTMSFFIFMRTRPQFKKNPPKLHVRLNEIRTEIDLFVEMYNIIIGLSMILLLLYMIILLAFLS